MEDLPLDCCIDNIYARTPPCILVHMKPCLPDDVPFGAVVSLVNRSRYVFLNDRLLPLGLSAGQFPVLMLLAKEQNIMQDRLVRHYHLDKGTIARAVKKLEDAGYIRRITDPVNRRAVRLFLTRKGEHAIPHLQAINRDWEDRIGSALSEEEAGTLRMLMRHVAGNSCAILAKDGEDGDDRE
jgi:MarR family transcriptional regulator, temperature-dependent positive regulator of motility